MDQVSDCAGHMRGYDPAEYRDIRMAEQVPQKMTVEEFFEWQQGQDRNYELVDGVPVLHRREAMGSPDNLRVVMKNLEKLAAAWQVDFDINERACRVIVPDANFVVWVVSPWNTDFDIATAIAKDLFSEVHTCLLIDTEQPRVGQWRGRQSQRRHDEAYGLAATIELPDIGKTLSLGPLYEGLRFQQAF